MQRPCQILGSIKSEVLKIMQHIFNQFWTSVNVCFSKQIQLVRAANCLSCSPSWELQLVSCCQYPTCHIQSFLPWYNEVYAWNPLYHPYLLSEDCVCGLLGVVQKIFSTLNSLEQEHKYPNTYSFSSVHENELGKLCEHLH